MGWGVAGQGVPGSLLYLSRTVQYRGFLKCYDRLDFAARQIRFAFLDIYLFTIILPEALER